MAVAGGGGASGLVMELYQGADMVFAQFTGPEGTGTHFAKSKAQIGGALVGVKTSASDAVENECFAAFLERSAG